MVAAQAHSLKEDRAIVISARNFIRALGGSAGLAIASAIFSSTLVSNIPASIPKSLAESIERSVFEMPDISDLPRDQQIEVLDAYVKAARSVFYLWAGAMGCCLALMVFIRDKGLKRNDEKKDSPAIDTDEEARVAVTVTHPVASK